MNQELVTLLITAASIGFFHTLFGPDHYLPFIVMAQARKWSLIKTTWITFLCGIGHVGSSVVLGMIGVAFGAALAKLEIIESFRGDLAAWALTAFGLVYFIWGMRRAVRNKTHTHFHSHGDREEHSHSHGHNKEHIHVHDKEVKANITPWILFTVFVLGPCEPLIPILMYPAAQSSLYGLVMVTVVFSVVTIATMISIVIISSLGVNMLPVKKLERYTHALAGAAIFLCGIAIQFLGL
jgi:ABC-type nickel/cobalt efflux system permease component RcnA